MCHQQDMVLHALYLHNDRPQAVNDVEIALSASARVAVMQLVALPVLEIVRPLLANLFISMALHIACVQLVKHAHLLHVVYFFIEVFGGLDTTLEHGGPHAKVLFQGPAFLVLLTAAGVLRIGWSGVTCTRRKMGLGMLLKLALVEKFSLL